jgi:RNA polymerase sigma-70 factor, ECF subfamily
VKLLIFYFFDITIDETKYLVVTSVDKCYFVRMPTEQISYLLGAWGDGDSSSLELLVPLVESELKRIARRHLVREKVNCSLQISDLINECYIKLSAHNRILWKNSGHFFAVASIVMRRILVNRARDKSTEKRGGGCITLNIDDVEIMTTERSEELILLDDALSRLAEFDRIKSCIIQLRYFGGLSIEETAKVLQISPTTVSRHWEFGRAWLAKEIKR